MKASWVILDQSRSLRPTHLAGFLFAGKTRRERCVGVHLTVRLFSVFTGLTPAMFFSLDSAVAERKAMERQRYFSEEALAAARAHCEDLEAQIAALHSENVMLTREVDALQGDLEMKVLENRPYCEKMAAHRKRFEEAESKLPFVVELARKRATVQQLMEKKEELLASLQEGEEEATVGQVQVWVVGLCDYFVFHWKKVCERVEGCLETEAVYLLCEKGGDSKEPGRGLAQLSCTKTAWCSETETPLLCLSFAFGRDFFSGGEGDRTP
uniref:Uncharacterized protein n=1 Tax=Naja naja TaxID=35670 RepID=A0A8C6Y966_NAJNA